MRIRGSKNKRPSADEADKALHDVVEAERERGDVNTGAEPDQKSEIQKPRDKEIQKPRDKD